MNFFPEMVKISLDNYVDEIKKNIESKNYLSALVVSLIIPDICQRLSNDHLGYAKWFNKYCYPKYYGIDFCESDAFYSGREISLIKLNGDVCYALRNAILHSGNNELCYSRTSLKEKAKIDHIELCLNGSSSINHQYGEAASITTNKNNKTISLRINIIQLMDCIIKGYEEFKKSIDNKNLITLIDWDKLPKSKIDITEIIKIKEE